MIDKVMLQRKMPRTARECLDYITGKARMIVFSPILIDLDLAADLMEAVARGNRRVKKPFYHFAFAWPNADAPTDEQMKEVAQGALQRLGLLKHQWVAAVHDDAGHPHIHVVANLVDPDTFLCASTSYDFFKLGQYATEVERQYGWMELRRYGAPGDLIQIGSLQLYERDLLPRSPGNGRRLTPMEAAFQKWLRDKVLKPALAATGCTGASWKKVRTVIGHYGVRYVLSGGGACFVDAADSSISIAASSIARFVSLPNLEKYLGAFDDVSVAIDVTRAFSRSAAILGLSATDPHRKLLSQYCFEKHLRREQTHSMRRDAWAAQRAKEVAQRDRIRGDCRDRLRGIGGKPKNVRLKARAQILSAKALDELERQHSSERHRLRAELSLRAKPEPWRQFVYRLARDGNSAAITYVQSTIGFAESDHGMAFSRAFAEPGHLVAGKVTANEGESMLPSVAYDSSARHVKKVAVAPIEGTFQQIGSPAKISEPSTQDNSLVPHQRLQRIDQRHASRLRV